jgi:Ni2+-binding GTPase involved in maturation of urease and hydrogenase
MGIREEFLENEIRTLNHHIQSMIDTMKVMSINKQDMSNEIERLKSEVETAVKDEREACAVIAFNAKTYLEAAAAIRARGQE